ncbi:MAG: phosphonopyruvate decarboxylase [Planctomycetes bacterium HGW-Planctomycetes-1]|nr:MAG: phosphonopyruvate decarboxylase [Planctomycetes bacterium HGW-Planctomycetes-1]
MVSCSLFYKTLTEKGIDFFAGVPDSLLKNFCAYVTDHAPENKHIIAANEGAAVALACGYHLATGKTGLVYMQNSGQGNAINPLVSLADPQIYAIPVLLLIGWRGEPGKKDEPQHIKQGIITLSLLDTLNIPYKLLPDTDEQAAACLDEIFTLMQKKQSPTAIVVRKGVFEDYKLQKNIEHTFELTREDAIKLLVDNLEPSDVIVSTTGKTSRELYEYREQTDREHSRDFLTIGSMGHTSQIAMGIAMSKPNRQVFCFDGDGAVIMHMGALATIGSRSLPNFKHIIFNNGSHDSVGGQPTVGFSISFVKIAQACGYKLAVQAQTRDEVLKQISVLKNTPGPALLEIKIRKGARTELGRPQISQEETKKKFMKFLNK